jgi:hypothetical protein
MPTSAEITLLEALLMFAGCSGRALVEVALAAQCVAMKDEQRCGGAEAPGACEHRVQSGVVERGRMSSRTEISPLQLAPAAGVSTTTPRYDDEGGCKSARQIMSPRLPSRPLPGCHRRAER